jgi:hypothetical protein
MGKTAKLPEIQTQRKKVICLKSNFLAFFLFFACGGSGV